MNLVEWLFGKPDARNDRQRAWDVWQFLASQHPHRTEVGAISRMTGMTESQARRAMDQLAAVGAIETFYARMTKRHCGLALCGPPHKRPARHYEHL